MTEPTTEHITDAEVIEVPEADGDAGAVSTALAPRESGAALFGTDDPMEIMQKTTEVASALKDFVGRQGLVSKISGRDYIVVEGWQMLGMMLGITPGKPLTTPVQDGWQSSVELFDRTGRVVGGGEAECLRSERSWAKRDDYALRSMAQTRAIAKAWRNTFGFVAKAAGMEATPAEEMPSGNGSHRPGLEFGSEASAKQIEGTRTALGYLLAEPAESKAVTEALDAIRRDAAYLPRISLVAVVRAAQAVKAMQEARDAEVAAEESRNAEAEQIADDVEREGVT